jgi:hypothetical protein
VKNCAAVVPASHRDCRRLRQVIYRSQRPIPTGMDTSSTLGRCSMPVDQSQNGGLQSPNRSGNVLTNGGVSAARSLPWS